MTARISRKELYDLVWSQPTLKLAERFGVPSVTVAKACAQMSVPVPPRGYWARRSAGKPVVTIKLPLRPPGLDDEIVVGGGRYWHYRGSFSREEALAPLPPVPTFDETIAAVRKRVEAFIAKVVVPRVLERPHPVIAKLLRQDEERRQKQLGRTYISTYDSPLYDGPAQQRCLRLLNAIFFAVAKCGGKADGWGPRPYDAPRTQFHIQIHHQGIRLAIGPREPRSSQIFMPRVHDGARGSSASC